MKTPCLVVIGEMNTDIIVSGLPGFPKPGHLVNGEQLTFGPGGKSRNIAAMAGTLLPAGAVVMIAKTAEDAHGLWRIPVEALGETGVDTTHVKVVPLGESPYAPGFAIILVDRQGRNQIIGAPGITHHMSKDDIDEAGDVLGKVGANQGFVAFTGNTPLDVAAHAIDIAVTAGSKIVFDPGGANDVPGTAALLDNRLYLFKPNEHEAAAVVGYPVIDFESAKQAANNIMARGVQNVLITAGSEGAFLFSAGVEQCIPAPFVPDSGEHDETGCGDQVLAALCVGLCEGKSLEEAARLAIAAGTLQFHRLGINPVTRAELGL